MSMTVRFGLLVAGVSAVLITHRRLFRSPRRTPRSRDSAEARRAFATRQQKQLKTRMETGVGGDENLPPPQQVLAAKLRLAETPKDFIAVLQG